MNSSTPGRPFKSSPSPSAPSPDDPSFRRPRSEAEGATGDGKGGGGTVVILQPSYLPWLGYFEQLHRSDVFVLYDDVQFEKGSWRNRNRIKTPNGPQWLTVPVLTSGRDFPLIRDVQIDNRSPWGRKHLNALRANYAKAPFFDRYAPELEKVFTKEWGKLNDLNRTLIFLLNSWLGLERKIVRSSDLGISGSGTDRLVAICKHFHATRFYEGAKGKDYIEPESFHSHGVELVYQDYCHPEYPQLHGAFIPYLSIVDLLFNAGPDSLEILAAHSG